MCCSYPLSPSAEQLRVVHQMEEFSKRLSLSNERCVARLPAPRFNSCIPGLGGLAVPGGQQQQYHNGVQQAQRRQGP